MSDCNPEGCFCTNRTDWGWWDGSLPPLTMMVRRPSFRVTFEFEDGTKLTGVGEGRISERSDVATADGQDLITWTADISGHGALRREA